MSKRKIDEINNGFDVFPNYDEQIETSNETEFKVVVDELTGLTLEVFIVLDQLHDFGENDDRNMLYTENDPEKLYLKFASVLLNYHWPRIKKKYENLKDEPLYRYLFNDLNLDKLVNIKSNKYKVSRYIVEHFHKIEPANLLDMRHNSTFDNWKCSDVVDLFKNFLVDLNINKLYVDCNKSKYNLYPILHLISNNSLSTDSEIPKIEVVKTVASIYDPSVSNSIETFVRKIQELKSNDSVEVVENYRISEKNYLIKTKLGKVIADFKFEFDNHFMNYDLFKTPDSYLASYNHDCKRKIQKSFKEQFTKDLFSASQKDFSNDPEKYIRELRKKLKKNNKFKNVPLNTYRVRAKINSFLDQTDFTGWDVRTKPFTNVSVRNVSNYVLKNRNADNVLNIFAFKTIGDFAQILEAKQGKGLFITADDQCAYISSLLTNTLFERDNDHVLCSLIHYGYKFLNLVGKRKRIKLS